MTDQQWDAIVVGAGLGGLAAAALLATNERWRVLVLEKEENVFGRFISFTGDRIHDWETDYKRPLGASARTRIERTIPDRETIIRERLFDGYVFEAGIHGVVPWGRIPYLMKAVGQPLVLYPNDGAQWWVDGRWYPLRRGAPIPWMTADEQEAAKNLTRAMVRATEEELNAWWDVSLRQWFAERTDSTRAMQFHAVAAGLATTLNDASLISAGENARISRQILLGGFHMSAGGTATVPYPGSNLIAERLCQPIRKAGGQVVTGARVGEITTKGRRVTGVVARTETGEIVARSDVVISNVPVQRTFHIIPENLFPSAWVEKVKNLWSAGGILCHFGLRRPILRGEACYVPNFLPPEAGVGPETMFAYWSSSSWAASRAPLGKQIIEGYVPTPDWITRDREKIDLVIDTMLRHMRTAHPDFEKNLEWAVFPVTNFLCGVAAAPGQVWHERPEVKSPDVEGLYFSSDSARSWGGASDAAVHAAFRCVTAITGKDYLALLPPYMR